MATLVPLLIIVILFAVMVIVPGRRRARDAQAMRASLAPGVDVVTTAGVYGRVDSIDAEQGTVDLEISAGVIVRFATQAVARVLNPEHASEGYPADRPDVAPPDAGDGAADRPGDGVDGEDAGRVADTSGDGGEHAGNGGVADRADNRTDNG